MRWLNQVMQQSRSEFETKAQGNLNERGNISMGRMTKMKLKDLEGERILLAHLSKSAESHRGSYPTHPRSQTIRFSKPLAWLRPSSPSAERQRRTSDDTSSIIVIDGRHLERELMFSSLEFV
jgi:hypothetical protein